MNEINCPHITVFRRKNDRSIRRKIFITNGIYGSFGKFHLFVLLLDWSRTLFSVAYFYVPPQILVYAIALFKLLFGEYGLQFCNCCFVNQPSNRCENLLNYCCQNHIFHHVFIWAIPPLRFSCHKYEIEFLRHDFTTGLARWIVSLLNATDGNRAIIFLFYKFFLQFSFLIMS